ncbi:MAG: heparan-alpha-glucosaminide N-acetyltransferase [Methanospirillum sp.]
MNGSGPGVQAVAAEILSRVGVKPRTGSARLPEVDLARAVALGMMIIYHFLFSLWYLGMVAIPVLTGFWRVFAYATASLFIGIAGLSLTLAAAARRRRGATEGEIAKAQARRGLVVLGWGFVITAVTLVGLQEGAIVFGVLHLIGLGTILAIPLVRRPRIALALGTVFVLLGPVATTISGPLALAWLGVHPADFVSLDYVPVLPWFGVLLIGVAAGWAIFPNGERRRPLPSFPSWTRPLQWIGRHTLAIYLLHEPVILAVLLTIRQYG